MRHVRNARVRPVAYYKRWAIPSCQHWDFFSNWSKNHLTLEETMNRPRIVKDTPVRGTLKKADIRKAVEVVKARRLPEVDKRVREEPAPERSVRTA